MESEVFLETTEECLIPNGFFDEDNSEWKALDLEYGGRTIKNELQYTSEEVVKRVYSLGRTLSKVFHDENLHYWTSGGTTLGAVRHKGLIPWDDDLDICILEDNEDQLLSNIKKILDIENEIKLVETLFGYRLFHAWDSEELDNRDYRYPFCDIFVMQTTLGKKHGRFCDIRTPAARSIWPKEKYKMTDIVDPKLMLFGDFYLNVCNNPENYLTNYYGENWREIGATQEYCHVRGQLMCPMSYEMNNEMYLAAYPFS